VIPGGLLVVVSGTGTGIGKTHFAEALLRALGQAHPRVTGLKPIETGLGESTVSDAARLERASTFHVQHFGYVFAESLSPHLAARHQGEPILLPVLASQIDAVRREADVTLVELPGGLFTPLSDDQVNADLARDLRPDVTILVAPDRLGVLHDVGAATRAARSLPLQVDAIVLVTPELADPSTGHNALELGRVLDIPVVATLPRASVEQLARLPEILALAASVSR
jgi:dethiobiotin synthetase